ncbi:hypothetical protein ACIBVL_01290 [Streptomyces sp. NPDC049687]|uniref:hypothetical protein n=1 Tax=Streptomyces sp. NPDC049687 TaxID=3365596 RepID=UPI00379A1526
MGIRMYHRRTATARVHVTATADTQGAPEAAPAPRPLPALAPDAATLRIPGTPATALRAAAARLKLRALARFVPRGGTWRRWAEQARSCLALALGALGRLRGPRPARRRITVFVVRAKSLSERPDGSARH